MSNLNKEVDLRKLFSVLWQGKLVILLITFIFALISVVYAVRSPNIYQSVTVLSSSEGSQSGALSSLANQYGGLAAMAGISIGGGDSSKVDKALKVLNSWPFIDSFIKQYQLKPKLLAVKGWDEGANTLLYDLDIFDPNTNEWNQDEFPLKGQPSDFDAYIAFTKLFKVTKDSKTGFVTIAIEYYSPYIANEWLILIKETINEQFQRKDIVESQKNIDYLKSQILTTEVSEMVSVFYKMIETQTKTLMLAKVSDEYLLKTVVPAKVAEQKIKPKRAIVCIIGTLIGAFLGVFVVLIRNFRKEI